MVFVFFKVYVLKRPHVDEFLKRMGELFECVLFTASLAKVGQIHTYALYNYYNYTSFMFLQALSIICKIDTTTIILAFDRLIKQPIRQLICCGKLVKTSMGCVSVSKETVVNVEINWYTVWLRRKY